MGAIGAGIVYLGDEVSLTGALHVFHTKGEGSWVELDIMRLESLQRISERLWGLWLVVYRFSVRR
jgi:hypothetical protein